jgi:enoyl-[acyl-carrier protein] reductase I
MIPEVKAKLLEGKRGLVVGIANDQSIAWGCARAFRALGAELAVTYLNDKARPYVAPLAEALEAPIVMPLDVAVPGQLEAVFDRITEQWGELDFVVHSIAFSPKDTLQGRVVDVPSDGFLKTMDISCWSFIRMAHLAEPLMKRGGTLFTMTYYGSQMVVKNYNVMGVAKAALESAVRYIAAELGPKGIRVHAISPGPLATRAASGIPEFDELLNKAQETAPARSLVSIDDVGMATAFLAHDAARLMTGDTIYIDGGYHIIDRSDTRWRHRKCRRYTSRTRRSQCERRVRQRSWTASGFSLGALFAVLHGRQAAPAPIVEIDFFDHHIGRFERLVEDVEQNLADALDDCGLLFGRDRIAVRRGSFAGNLYSDDRHFRLQ